MTFLRLFLFGWHRHDDLTDRDAQQNLVFRCQVCGRVQPLLQSSLVRGPQASPRTVPGQPKLQAVTANKVESIHGRKRA